MEEKLPWPTERYNAIRQRVAERHALGLNCPCPEHAANKLLLDSRLSQVQWQALQAWLDEVADELTPSAAGILQVCFDQIRRRAELQDLAGID